MLLLGSGFFTAQERNWLARMRHPRRLLGELLRLWREAAGAAGGVPEAYEAELMDEDALRPS